MVPATPDHGARRFRFPVLLVVAAIVVLSVYLIRNRAHTPTSLAILPFSNLDSDPSLQPTLMA